MMGLKKAAPNPYLGGPPCANRDGYSGFSLCSLLWVVTPFGRAMRT